MRTIPSLYLIAECIWRLGWGDKCKAYRSWLFLPLLAICRTIISDDQTQCSTACVQSKALGCILSSRPLLFCRCPLLYAPITLLYEYSCVSNHTGSAGNACVWLVHRCPFRLDWFLCCRGSLHGFTEGGASNNPSGCMCVCCFCLCVFVIGVVVTCLLLIHS